MSVKAKVYIAIMPGSVAWLLIRLVIFYFFIFDRLQSPAL